VFKKKARISKHGFKKAKFATLKPDENTVCNFGGCEELHSSKISD